MFLSHKYFFHKAFCFYQVVLLSAVLQQTIQVLGPSVVILTVIMSQEFGMSLVGRFITNPCNVSWEKQGWTCILKMLSFLT